MVPVLRAAIGTYPHTRALKSGEVKSDFLRLDFAELSPINRAFAPMVRESKFDVCEMAITTFLQAKAYGKPLVLLPVVMAARFQEGALLCRADSDLRGPADLVGRRVGVRPTARPRGCGCGVYLPRLTGCDQNKCIGSRSKMRTWQNIAIHLG